MSQMLAVVVFISIHISLSFSFKINNFGLNLLLYQRRQNPTHSHFPIFHCKTESAVFDNCSTDWKSHLASLFTDSISTEKSTSLHASNFRYYSISSRLCKHSCLAALFFVCAKSFRVNASSAASAASSLSPTQGLILWGLMFVVSSTLHSAESAITKISSWKIQQLAEEEGTKSPFTKLSSNLTSLLSSVVLATTALSIYSTALFVTSLSKLFPNVNLGILTAILLVITIFFGEVFPKAIAVGNSELIARKLLPAIYALASILSPVTIAITYVSNILLSLLGLRREEDKNVSEGILRLVVDEAQRSEGIERGEGKMINNVLDMQNKEVKNVMQPRIDIVALPADATAKQILDSVSRTKYSRIPIFKDGIDHIVGIVFAKDLLDLVNQKEYRLKGKNIPVGESLSTADDVIWNTVIASDLMESTYFIPETMSAWVALQEMRKRRIHMAVVVDEYGGTAGLITLEDILEEVVGEIYDEDDGDEHALDTTSVFSRDDGAFEILGSTEIDVACETIGMPYDEGAMDEYSTIGGYLCSVTGEIPRAGHVIVIGNFQFTILDVEDNRRILRLLAETKPIDEIKITDNAARDTVGTLPSNLSPS